MRLQFGVEAYQHRSRPVAAQRLVNCYLESAPKGEEKGPPLVSSYGITQLGTIGGRMRGGAVINGVPYVVSGQRLYKVTPTFEGIDLGSIPGAGVVDIVGDEDEVFVVSEGEGYIYNGVTTTFIADTDFPGAERAEYLDGYAIVVHQGSMYINETPHVFTGWNALDFAAAEASPDDVLDGIVDHRQYFAGGRDSIEVFENSGDADFPLTRVPGGLIELGIGSVGAFTKQSNTVFFYASDGTIRMLDGYNPQRISTHAVEQSIEDYADKRCTAFSFMEAGHAMVSFTWAEGTWVYDLSTALWHQRKSHDEDRWRPLTILRAYDRWLVLDHATNKLGALDPDATTEFGETMRWTATAPSVNSENDFLRHQRLELVFENGVGVLSGQGSDPQAMLRFSDDGGRTWSNEYWRSIGAQGDYRARAVWNRLGMARDRVYEVTISDPVRRTLVQAILNG
jgi:hypothetical protein